MTFLFYVFIFSFSGGFLENLKCSITQIKSFYFSQKYLLYIVCSIYVFTNLCCIRFSIYITNIVYNSQKCIENWIAYKNGGKHVCESVCASVCVVKIFNMYYILVSACSVDFSIVLWRARETNSLTFNNAVTFASLTDSRVLLFSLTNSFVIPIYGLTYLLVHIM